MDIKHGKRWVLLRHTGDPNDEVGIHFDLLIEDSAGCRTWKLFKLPKLDAPAQRAIQMPTHKIIWLERSAGKVSGERGWAQRIFKGFFVGELPSEEANLLRIELYGTDLQGVLVIQDNHCQIRSFEK